MARILVIDDDWAVRRTIEAILGAAGHSAAMAGDGEDGIAQFRQAPCDLVLCDIFMPKKSGIGTLRSLREMSGSVPIVMMSGGAPRQGRLGVEFIDYLELARMYGATDTIAKPFKAAELIAVVERALRAGGEP
jgi:CheY-like chemotaxis protein